MNRVCLDRDFRARRGRKSFRSLSLAAFVIGFIDLACAPAVAATLENADRNYWITVIDALPDNKRTRLLYLTYPDINQAHVREACTVNYYTLDLQPGLDNVQPRVIAQNVCGRNLKTPGALLAAGDAVIVSGDRIETWRPGKGQIGAWALSDVASLQAYGPDIWRSDMQLDIYPDGNLVAAVMIPRQRNDTTTPSGVVAGLSSDGRTRWQVELDVASILLAPFDVWATADGGALLHATARPMDGVGVPGANAPEGFIINAQNRLYRISPAGELSAPVVIASMQMPDVTQPQSVPNPMTDPDGYRAYLNRMSAGNTGVDGYSAGQVIARAQGDGSMDVLMGRGTRKARYMRIGTAGQVLRDVTLDQVMEEEGLTQTTWEDGITQRGDVLLFGALHTRSGRLAQGYVSRLDVPPGDVETRLAPLSNLGLQAARQASDATVQFLEHNPAQQPQMLTTLAGQPLLVSRVTRSRKLALQIDELNNKFAVYTEAREARAAQAAKAAQRRQRKAAREARSEQLDADMASALGVSQEQYAAMSNEEREEAMIRNGDMNAMMAAAMRQAQEAMQQMNAQPGTADPNADPEMAAQMAAAMAQMQQALAAQGMSVPNMPGAQLDSASPAGSRGPRAGVPVTAGGDFIKLDAGGRGFVEYLHPDAQPTTLVITDQRSGRELLKKTYAAGEIYEYVDFSRFGVPLERINVLFQDATGTTLQQAGVTMAK